MRPPTVSLFSDDMMLCGFLYTKVITTRCHLNKGPDAVDVACSVCVYVYVGHMGPVPSKNASCPLFIVLEMKTDYCSIKYDTSYALFNSIIFCRLRLFQSGKTHYVPVVWRFYKARTHYVNNQRHNALCGRLMHFVVVKLQKVPSLNVTVRCFRLNC